MVTGTLSQYTRDQIQELITQHGGHAASSVSGKTDYVVAGESREQIDQGPRARRARADRKAVRAVAEGMRMSSISGSRILIGGTFRHERYGYDIRYRVGSTSRKLTLLELAERLERTPQSGSHDKGTPRGLGGETWEQTVWRENASDANATWCEQALQLLRDMPSGWGGLFAAERDDVSISIDVAVFCVEAYWSLHLPTNLIDLLSAMGVGFDVTIYPTCGDGPEGGRR